MTKFIGFDFFFLMEGIKERNKDFTVNWNPRHY